MLISRPNVEYYSNSEPIRRVLNLVSRFIRRQRATGTRLERSCLIGMSCKDIRERYQRAEECRHKAQTASSELMKANFLQMEQRWFLSRSYEVTESVSNFTNSFRTRGRSKE